ncbi:MAG TPA: type II toxin-antitoxin system prevent-host-death family antitoxin [Candidatus Brocadiaceae bacterium]|nr:type II toxin-antitoxin system prevent-host-death family antitoxin [Candidatus Brocadiaceae bacterium]
MLQVGLREANMHFSKYLKLVREGQEVVVTERGNPVAVIKPLMKERTPEDKIKSLEDQGVLRRAVKGKLPLGKAISIAGKPLSEAIIEGREERF